MGIDAIGEIASTLRYPEKHPHPYAIYLFGSAASGVSRCSDIDLLCIYESTSTPDHIRGRLAPISLTIPLDLLFMTKDEATETDFVKSENALLLFCHPTPIAPLMSN